MGVVWAKVVSCMSPYRRGDRLSVKHNDDDDDDDDDDDNNNNNNNNVLYYSR